MCEVITVSAGPVEINESYSASLRGRQDIEIYPQVSGKITRLCVTEGQKVRKGEVMFVIDQVPYQAALRTAIANVHAAEAQVETARFLALSRSAFRWFRRKKQMKTDTQYYYFRCPSCGQSMRLPRGVGKVEVTCRSCSSHFLIQS